MKEAGGLCKASMSWYVNDATCFFEDDCNKTHAEHNEYEGEPSKVNHIEINGIKLIPITFSMLKGQTKCSSKGNVKQIDNSRKNREIQGTHFNKAPKYLLFNTYGLPVIDF